MVRSTDIFIKAPGGFELRDGFIQFSRPAYTDATEIMEHRLGHHPDPARQQTPPEGAVAHPEMERKAPIRKHRKGM